jgi:hypothetical protein
MAQTKWRVMWDVFRYNTPAQGVYLDPGISYLTDEGEQVSCAPSILPCSQARKSHSITGRVSIFFNNPGQEVKEL